MIVDSLKNISRYTASHPNIRTALEFAASHLGENAPADGTYVLIPDQVIIHVISKDTHPRETAQMELHEQFMDIHAMISGSEACCMGPVPATYNYDAKGDIAFWDCEDNGCVCIDEGEFYAVWPMEPHCPLCSVDGTRPIRKMICKVRVD